MIKIPSMLKKVSFTHVSYIALISSLSGAALMTVRFSNLISLNEPLQITASGAEYESLYVIWKYIQGLTIFVDHFRIPFAGTFYNWLYYAFYGELSGSILKILDLTDSWIPTITKIITVIGLIYGTWITYLCFSLATPVSANMARFNFSGALFVFLGPLSPRAVVPGLE